ncbi:family 43 glycosylhydrolase [Pedobacter jamesrossensis]|uniref:Family 43 glycosylhydrolase n=1 Tax=Pedobacter jamesrossensis TaxID=1908238 RepID=A0ABV8NQQ3_9SPHI
MKISELKFFVFLVFGFYQQMVNAQSSHLDKGMGNPIIPGYFADPTVKQFGDTFYIYATTDGNGGGFGPSQVWTSKDFVNWAMQDMNWPTTHHYWAPDATLGPDGKYYLYYCQPVEIFGASSSSPVGPWTSLLEPKKPIVPNFLVPNVITLDGQTFKDDDGKYYMYWGTWGIYPNHGCGVGLLNADMKSFSKLAQIPNTDAKDFFEAPFVFKRNGVYYLTYSSGYCEDGTYRVQYATAISPMGPFKYAANNPILSTNAHGTVHGPGHQSVLQQGDDFYLIYHRHNNPHADGGYHRQVAADKIIFDDKGNILKLIPTHTGIGYLGKNENPHPNLALGKTVLASSIYDQDFKAEYAVDDNNGTLWKPKNNIGKAWLRVDLGKVTNVRSVHTQFEYATWYYQYKIEYSLDGKLWKLYADRSRNTQHGSPMIDFGNVNARYLRTTILRTEYPGLNKAIWNIKVFDNADYHPEMKTVVKKWSSLAEFESKGLLIDLDLSTLRISSLVKNIPNKGKLGGLISAFDAYKPEVSIIDGKKALLFHGRERLVSSSIAPKSLSGNSSYSVSMWVLNPEIADEETIVSWTKKGGNDLSNVGISYGKSKRAGATSHLGWADLGYKQLPKANVWHHISMVFDGTMERIYVDGKLDRQERRMLFVSNLSRFFIGGNEDESNNFSGALASLKVYDKPLTEKEVVAEYDKGTRSDIAVYADAKNLNYGLLKEWTNNGYALGKLSSKGNLEVADVNGKIAVKLASGTGLKFGSEINKAISLSKEFSFILSLFSPIGTKTNLFFGKDNESVSLSGTGKWQQVICNFKDGKFQILVDGKLSKNFLIKNKQKKEGFSIAADGKTNGFQTVISSICIYNYRLDVKASLQEFNYWKQTQQTSQIKASFESKPLAVSPNMIYMIAGKPKLPGESLEYLFSKGNDGNNANWVRSSSYTDFSVSPDTKYNYKVKVKDNYGNVTKLSLPTEVKTDLSLFKIKKTDGDLTSIPLSNKVFSGVSWDGVIGNADTVIQNKGVLKMVSHNTFWDGTERIGPFAYHNVEGGFIAEVKIDDFLGLSQKKVYGANEVGIMVRNPNNKNLLLQNGVMMGWGVGNIITNLSKEERKQTNNLAGWNFFRYLQIQRIGNTFFMRGSTDGKQWAELPGSPIKRDDVVNKPLQIGIYQVTNGDISGYGIFSDFKIIQRINK